MATVNKLNDFEFGTLNLKCASCTPTEKADGFILKLVHSHTIEKKTPFGNKVQPVQHTFYMKVQDECKPDFAADMNLDEWRITERPFVIDENGEEKEILLKWLHLGE